MISTIISLVLFEKGKVGLTKAEEDDATGAQYGMMMISVILVTIISVFCIVTGENAFIRILIALGLGVASAACAFATAVVKEMFS